jgi:hypothetical protein
MTDELASLAVDLSEIVLEGDGPFALPACQADVDLRITATFPTLVMRTVLEGKEVHVEFSHAVLRRLRTIADKEIARLEAVEKIPPV